MNKLLFKHKRRTKDIFIKNYKSTKEQLKIKKSIYSSYLYHFPYKDNLFLYYRIQVINAFTLQESFSKELKYLEIIIHERVYKRKKEFENRPQWEFTENDWNELLKELE